MQQNLEDILRDLPAVGRQVENRPDRQVWQFEFEGKAYWLRFHPAEVSGGRLRRRLFGSPAMREFVRLQWLQKAHVPAVRAAAVLMGYQLAGQRGDAVLVHAIEPSVQLDAHLSGLELEGRAIPDRLSIVKQIIDILQTMAKARLGHGDLRLGSFLLKDGRVYLGNAEAVHRSGLLLDDLLLLALSAARHATLAEVQRVWNALGPGGVMPGINRRGPSAWRSEMKRVFADPDCFGRMEWAGGADRPVRHGGNRSDVATQRRGDEGEPAPGGTPRDQRSRPQGQWSGVFFKWTALPQRWSAVSRMRIGDVDWAAAWPELQRQIDAGELKVLKHGRSGDVREGTVTLGGQNVAVVVKRPGRNSLRRSLTQVFCGSRARQAWEKAWGLAVRGIPTAWPMLLMEKRVHGYVTDSLLVMERVEGPVLAKVDAAADPRAYRVLLGRCGRLLREIERSGLFLYDAKAYNWIVMADPQFGPTPVLIDADSMRRMRVSIGGLNRLLRSLREDTGTGLTVENALALVRGYRPFASRAEAARLAGVKA
ncbi:MAG: lipopolysaccharide kinase InaA family protein [Tepidisphaeraceae bacterium]